MIEQQKHAYLILAHNNFGQLKKLLMLLDDSRNDIYIHLDKKAIISQKELNELSHVVTKASLEWVKRINVNWGGYSQVKAELILLRTAAKKPHLYYHLLSGADLPIKSQDEIHSFFASHTRSEYIGFQQNVPSEYWIDQRIREYHFFQDSIGRNPGCIVAVLERLEMYSLRIQKKLKINRIKGDMKIYKGDQWFSITHDLAKFILSRSKEMKKLLNYGLCVDELFVQTIAMNSPFYQNVICDTKREIDWQRGGPYTWRAGDYNQLMNSKAFWARKFNEQIDSDIIDAIFDTLRS